MLSYLVSAVCYGSEMFRVSDTLWLSMIGMTVVRTGHRTPPRYRGLDAGSRARWNRAGCTRYLIILPLMQVTGTLLDT